MSLLHIRQSSLLNSLPAEKVREELDRTIGNLPDAIGFTECAPHHLRPIVAQHLHRHGYELHGSNGDTAIAVWREHEVLDFGSVLVNPASEVRPGRHGPRFVDWVAFNFDGNEVYFHEAHWLTKFSDRPSEHMAMTNAMIENVTTHAKGKRLSLFGGDVNISERVDVGKDRRKPDFLFNTAGLTTIWDELDTLKGTHGGAVLDIIGSYDKDRRVEADHVQVHKPLYKDHWDVSAYYNIAE